MKKQKGFTLLGSIFMFIIVISIGSWLWNATKLASCDFKSDYRCEIIHGAGLIIPPISIVTVWFADDDA